MTDFVDLPTPYRREIEALLRRHLPGVEAWAYGSRVNGESHPGSDLDLALRGPGLDPLPADKLLDLAEAFERSNIPILVQAHDWTRLPESFHQEIERRHVVLAGRQEDCLDPEAPPMRRRTTLGECATINAATYSPKEAWLFINYLDTGNITDNRITEIQRFEPGRDKIPSRARRKCRPGDIVYSMVRPNQRHFGLLREVPENFLVSTGFAVLRGKDGIADTDYLHWFLAQDHIIEYLHSIAENSTSAYPSIRLTDLDRLVIDLPSLPEQRAIARILGTLQDKIELKGRARLRRGGGRTRSSVCNGPH